MLLWGQEVNAWINTSCDWARGICSEKKVWIIQPWKYNSLLVTNTICQEHWWAHQGSKDAPALLSRTAVDLLKLSLCMEPVAMFVLLCHRVKEHNYLNLTRWEDLWGNQLFSYSRGEGQLWNFLSFAMRSNQLPGSLAACLLCMCVCECVCVCTL